MLALLIRAYLALLVAISLGLLSKSNDLPSSLVSILWWMKLFFNWLMMARQKIILIYTQLILRGIQGYYLDKSANNFTFYIDSDPSKER